MEASHLLAACLVCSVGWAAEAEPRPNPAGPNGHVLVTVPAGTYLLGEKDHRLNPWHKARLKAFQIADAETTFAQFSRFVAETHYVTDAERRGWGKTFHAGLAEWEWDNAEGATWRRPFGLDRPAPADEEPVTQISGDDARAYCHWLGGRLPTCDEWEAAARAGSRDRWPWGDHFIPGRANVWNGETHEAETAGPDGDGFVYLAPVRSFPPNRWGLYDVIGNVFEYCADLPPVLRGREKTIIAGRGGSWWCSANTCHSFNLVDIGHMDRHGSLANQGFRIVFDMPPTPSAKKKK